MLTKHDKICPLCQQNNRCQINENTPCWCTKEVISEQLLASIPKEKRGKVCICQACIRKFNVDLATRAK